jgi:hypothetical protein
MVVCSSIYRKEKCERKANKYQIYKYEKKHSDKGERRAEREIRGNQK